MLYQKFEKLQKGCGHFFLNQFITMLLQPTK